MRKAVERTGYADFWELRSRGVLPLETTNYVPIILAMTIMEKNARRVRSGSVPLDPPLEYDTIRSSAPTSLRAGRGYRRTPLAEMAALNPSSAEGSAGAGGLCAARAQGQRQPG